MFFRWFKNFRRRRLLAKPFPVEWDDVLTRNVAFYAALPPGEQRRMRDYVRVFVAEKNWEGCGGLEMTDEIKVTISGQVATLVRGFEGEYFERVLSILVYPEAYLAQGKTNAGGGTILEEELPRSGEAWYRGPVILSWGDVLAGGRRSVAGRNLVFHEFAHQLDMLNGRMVDGIPPLDTREQYDQWKQVQAREYQRLVDDCEQGLPTLLDCYGASSVVEFFAVATEVFFMRPEALLRRHGRLYEVMSRYYRQDPAVELSLK